MSKKLKLKRKFIQSGKGWYTFKTIKEDDGSPAKARIQRIDLLELGILKQIPFDDVAPADLVAATGKKGGKAAQDVRKLALDLQAKVEKTALDFLTSDEEKGIQLGIQVIDAGCPDLSGEIKLRDEDCEWTLDEEGEPLECLDMTWKDLGEDFPDLIQAILVISKIWKERSDKARKFR